MQASLGAKGQTMEQAQPRTFAGRVRGFIAAWQERRTLARELASLDDRELSDIGLMRWQVPLFVKAYPTADRLLGEMLARLGLEADEALNSRLLHDDVYRSCALCREHGRCRRWLSTVGAVAAPPAFCPNAWTFRQMLQAKWAASQAAPNPSGSN